MKKKVGLLLLLIAMIMSFFTSTVFAATPIVYVSLGDSIATGSTSRGTMTSYAYQIRKSLIDKYGENVTASMIPKDGATSLNLRDLVINPTMEGTIRSATIITISIGGNNVMKAGKNFFSFIDGLMAQSGVNSFKNEYPQIISRIRELNPNTLILSSTLYNPYNIGTFSGYKNNVQLQIDADKYIKQINEVILNNQNLAPGIVNPTYMSFAGKYTPVKVYDTFIDYAKLKKMGTYTYFYPSSFFQFLRDPHPTQLGQNMLFELHNAQIPAYLP